MNTEVTPEQIAEQEKLQADMKAFNDGLGALIQKTGITVVPQLSFGAEGIRPVLKLGRFTPAPEMGADATAKKAPVAPKKRVKKQ